MYYQEFRKKSDQVMPSVKSILGKAIIAESSFKEDTEQAFDLITPKQKRIACRVREYEKYSRYLQDFTIRKKPLSNVETEYHKILKGFGDWMFYGFYTKDQQIKYYSIIDLDVFRQHHQDSKYSQIKNYDGTIFCAYKLGSFPKNMIVDSNIEIKYNYLQPI